MSFEEQRNRSLSLALALTLFASGCGGSSDGFVSAPTSVFQTQTQTQTQTETNPTPTDPVDVDPDSTVLVPVANGDTFVALGNASITQSADNGLLRNDEVNGATVTPFQGSTDKGASLTINADGSFSYSPSSGFLGTDRFSYTLSNSAGSATADALVVVSERGYFVDTTAATNGDGTQSDPFDNLTDAFNVALQGDTVFVFAPSSISGQIDVPRGINLIGQGAGLILAQTVVDPGVAPILTGPVVPSSENVISGFRISGSATEGVSGVRPFNVVHP